MKRPGNLQRRRKRRAPVEIHAAARWAAAVMGWPEVTLVTAKEFDTPWSVYEILRHHVIPQQTLRRRARELGIDEEWLVWDPRVGIKVSKRRHERHHSGHEPILRRELPDRVLELAEEIGLTWYIDRHYPKETP